VAEADTVAGAGLAGLSGTSRAPLVSVGLPVRDGADYLAEAIASVLAQDFEDFELIISDNASTDATPAICRAAAERDPRVRYVRHETLVNVAENFTRALEPATGRLFVWIAHDDTWRPTFLSECVRALEAHPRAILAIPDIDVLARDGTYLGTHCFSADIESDDRCRRLRWILRGGGAGATYGVMRTEMLKRTGCPLPPGMTPDWLPMALSVIGPFAHVPRPLSRYRSTRALSERAEAVRTYYFPDPSSMSFVPLRHVLGHVMAQLWRFARRHDVGLLARLGLMRTFVASMVAKGALRNICLGANRVALRHALARRRIVDVALLGAVRLALDPAMLVRIDTWRRGLRVIGRTVGPGHRPAPGSAPTGATAPGGPPPGHNGSAAWVDGLINRAASPEHADAGLDHLATKLDHLVHALRLSGRLGGLSHAQVVNILHALRAGGHEAVPMLECATYNRDGLMTIHNADFLTHPRFTGAYGRAVKAAGGDYRWQWRVYVGLWAASHAVRLPGDFVECGVNRGFLSSAVMEYLDWNRLDKRFYLLDTFRGLDERFLCDEERALGKTSAFNNYTECYEEARKNFVEFRDVHLIRGSIPDTLPLVDTERICYLHIDMNCALPELAAIGYFWDKLVPGAAVLLDDYAYHGFAIQKRAMDGFAVARGVEILSLPTGQGFLLKPP
jgi:Glycosyl transferase family 2/Macrocin-O-methyltransferase (TylF)